MSDVRDEIINKIGYYIPDTIFNLADTKVLDNYLLQRYEKYGDYGLKYTNYAQNYHYGTVSLGGGAESIYNATNYDIKFEISRFDDVKEELTVSAGAWVNEYSGDNNISTGLRVFSPLGIGDVGTIYDVNENSETFFSVNVAKIGLFAGGELYGVNGNNAGYSAEIGVGAKIIDFKVGIGERIADLAFVAGEKLRNYQWFNYLNDENINSAYNQLKNTFNSPNITSSEFRDRVIFNYEHNPDMNHSLGSEFNIKTQIALVVNELLGTSYDINDVVSISNLNNFISNQGAVLGSGFAFKTFALGDTQGVDNEITSSELFGSESSVTLEDAMNDLLFAVEEDTKVDKISKSENASIALKVQNEGGGYETVIINPTKYKIELFETQFADAKVNGIVIASTSNTVVNPDGSISVLSQTQIEDSRGNTYIVNRNELAANSPVTPQNGIVLIENVYRQDVFGNYIGVTQNTVFKDNGKIFETHEYQYSPEGNWHVQQIIKDINGTVLDDGPIFIVPSDELLGALNYLGATAGSFLANYLADGNVYKQLVYKALIPTITEHFGTFAAYLATGSDIEAAARAFMGEAIQGSILNTPEFQKTFYKNFNSAVSSALSNLIVDEVGEALGIDGVAGEVFNVVGGTITTGIISEGVDLIFSGMNGGIYTNLLAGGFNFSQPIVDPNKLVYLDSNGVAIPNSTVGEYIQLQVFNALGAFAGSKLAGEVIQPESEMAALFGSAGGAIGTAIASGEILAQYAIGSVFKSIATLGWAGGPLGLAIGAFLGTVFGTALGNALGSEEHPSSWGFLNYNVNTKEYYVSKVTENDGGGTQIGEDLATALANGINGIIAQTHGNLRSTSVANDVTIGWKQGEFLVTVDGDTRTFDNSGEAISFAAFKMLKEFDLVGGHAVIMRAWHNSDAQNLEEFKEDIQVAEAFINYLQNPTGILALMMDQPDSQLAQSWAVILQRAAEMKLHLPNEYDFDGGWNEVLIANGVNPESLANIEETTLTVTDPVTGKDTVFHHLIGPGYEIVRIEGTDGNDIINVKIDGPSIAYVDAGSGDDVIEGSEDRDVIFGGSGDDTINGNGGDDWLNGGAGNDTINGNNGLDLIVGGEDNDVLTGGAHADNIYGGKGNDVLTGGVEADKLYGGEGNDVLHGDDDNSVDQLSGGAGNDILNGYNGDIIVGGAGNDQITVDATAAGNEGVRIGRGDGNDIITFGENVGQYTIAFDPSIALNEVWFHRDPDNSTNMIVSILGENQNIKLLNYANHDIRVEVMSDYFVSLNSLNNPEYQPYLNLHPTTDTNDVPLQQRAEMSRKLLGVWKTYSSISRFIHDSEMDNVILNDNVNPTKVIKYTDISEFLYTVGSPTWNTKGYSQFMAFYDRVKEAYENDLFMRVSLSGNSGLSGRNLVGGTGDDTLIALNDPGLDYYNAFIAGGAGNDSIYGTDRYLEGYLMDILIGGEGNDQIYANQGDDRAWGGNGTDLIKGEDQEDLLYGDAGNDTIYGNNDDDEIYGGEGDDTLYGDDVPSNISQVGQDVINGGAGNDLIYGGAKDDTLDGGIGNDTIYGGTENDVLLGGEGDDHLYGEAGDDMHAGDAGNDTIYGSAGNDIIDGGSGNDTVNYATSAGVTVNLNTRTLSGGDAAGDTITGIENMTGSAFNDVLTGNSENNIIRGGNGNDSIDGAGGDDLLYGEAGTDTVTYISSGVGVTVSLAITTSQDTKGAGVDTLSGFENLTGSAFGDTLTGDAGANTLAGGDGDDSLEGGAGNDIISGGAGIDVASYKSASSAVTVSLAITAAQNTGGAGTDTISGMQNLIGSQYNDVLTGDGSGNVIEGGAGNDTLDGAAGTDTVSYEGTASAVTVNLATTAAQNTGGGGTDTLISFENIRGSSLNDTLTGDANNNIIEGGDGNDVIDGAAGTDTASYKSASSEVTVNLAITGQQNTGGGGTDTLLNIERLIGSAYNDILTGNTGTNQIEGGAGDDIMDGGAGNDTLSYQSATAGVTVSLLLTEEQDTLGAGKDTIINFEHITGSAYNDVLIGNAGANTLKGGDGNDTLDGGAGNDTITGENGVDTVSYLSAVSAVTVNLTVTAAQNTGGGGTDTITTVENITGSDFNDVLTGDAGANTLKGGSGNDLLEGAGGDDKLYGDFGIDTVSYAASGAAVTVNLGLTDAQNTLGAGTDTLSGIENITGSAFDDTITGDNGDNIIEAGAGNDILIGRGGKDTLSYKAAASAITVSLAITAAQSTGGAGSDTISQFENILGSAHNDILTGDDNDNVIEGAGGNDVLNGGAGADTVSYVSAGSSITVNLTSTSAQNTGGAGSDTLSNFENVTGSSFNDTLTGNGSDNVIEGGKGDDILDGAAGTDTVSYETASAGITVNIAVTAAQNTLGAGTDTLTNFEKIIGSDYSDILTGNSSANQIEGGEGDDILDGAAGTDTVSYSNADTGVSVNLSLTSAQSTGGAGSDTITNFENLTGSYFNDVLTGDTNANTIKGGYGNDTIEGGNGDDILSGEIGTDTLSYQSAAAGITINLAVTTAQNTGGAGSDTIATFENIKGSAFDDVLFGDAGTNLLYGGAGNDILEGAGGDDSLYGETGIDTASYTGAASAVTVNLSLTVAQDTLGAGSDLLKDIENITGSAYADILTGDSKSNQIEGGAGNDVIDGGAGTDTISFASSAGVTFNLGITAQQNTGAGLDTITNFENILGSANNDTLTGDGNANVIEGGAGNDVLNGGAGIDTLSYSKSGGAVTVNLATTTSQNTGGAGSDTVSGFENLTGSIFADTLTGDAGDNTISGGDGNDVIQGGLGNDTLLGNAGTDTLTYAAATAGVTVNLSLSLSQNTVNAGSDTLFGFENLTGSGYTDTLTGDGYNNVIDGGNGSDVIEGGGGDDTLIGGSGTDTASYVLATSAVSVSLAITAAQNTLGAGTDTLSGFERITGSNYADTLIGDANANVLTGGEGDDILEGGAGDDVLYGGNGYDTASYKNASAVTVSLAVTASQNTVGAGWDTLSSIQNLIGSAYNDTLTGNTSDNVIEGGAGNDVLNGGNGNDTVSYSLAGSAVTINLATTTQQNTGLGSGLDTITAFENITGSAFNDTLTGDANANVIEGGAGNDILDGAAGTDTLSYKGAESGVVVSIAVSTQQDTIGAGLDTVSNFERLIGSSYHDTLTGNSGTNQIEGGAGNDIMDGGAGTDTLSYQSSAAGVTVNLAVTAAQNTLGAGTDTISNFEHITGSAYDDVLTGNSGSNTLKGGSGNDTIIGGGGTDTLYGEAGADIFGFDPLNAFTAQDTISDFSLAQGDKLDISDLLSGFDPLTSAITDFVRITDNGTNSFLAVDADGGANNFIQIATLSSVIGLTDEAALRTSGNLITV